MHSLRIPQQGLRCPAQKRQEIWIWDTAATESARAGVSGWGLTCAGNAAQPVKQPQPAWLNQNAAEAGKACIASAPMGLRLRCNLVAVAAMLISAKVS